MAKLIEARFWSYVDFDGPMPKRRSLGKCWVWTGYTQRYGHFSFMGKVRLAHRVSWFLTHGKWPIPCCLHKCDNQTCVRSSHLFAGTRDDNNKDMKAKGRTEKGSARWNSKLTESAAKQIRERYAAGGISQQKLAEKYGVCQNTISEIVARNSWAHV